MPIMTVCHSGVLVFLEQYGRDSGLMAGVGGLLHGRAGVGIGTVLLDSVLVGTRWPRLCRHIRGGVVQAGLE